MSLYGKKWSICGVPTGYIRRVGTKDYEIHFEREYATIEDIESIDWQQPVIELLTGEECPLPAGSFATTNISYNDPKKYYALFAELRAVCYGDVAAYAQELEQRRGENAALNEDLAEADSAVASLYEQLGEIGSTVEMLRDDLAAKGEQIERLSADLAAKSEQIENLSADLAEADEMVQTLFEQANNMTEEENHE